MADARWRARIERLRLAGLTHVAGHRMAAARPPADAASAPPSEEERSMPEQPTMPFDEPLPAEAPAADKPQALAVLAEEVAGCPRCEELVASRRQTVFGTGDADAEICFVGEAPGEQEDRTGEPFVGKSGQLLTRIIEACKLTREQVYICNTIKCRPPGNRNPTAEEVENCRPFFERQLAIIRPKMMVALGKYAAANLLERRPEKVPIMKMRGEIHQYRGIPFMITLHPAYLLRNPAAKRDVWDDMKKVMREIGRPID